MRHWRKEDAASAGFSHLDAVANERAEAPAVDFRHAGKIDGKSSYAFLE